MARYISNAKARQIAHQWHGPGSMLLESFASGAVVPSLTALLQQIRVICEYPELSGATKTEVRNLYSLFRYVQGTASRVNNGYAWEHTKVVK